MLNKHEVCAQIVVHDEPFATRYWSATEATPEPESDALALSASVPVSGVPGSANVVAGTVLSTRREGTSEVRE